MIISAEDFWRAFESTLYCVCTHDTFIEFARLGHEKWSFTVFFL